MHMHLMQQHKMQMNFMHPSGRMRHVGVQSGSPQRTKRDDELAADWHELMNRYHRITCQLDRELMSQHQLTVSEFEVLQQLALAPDKALKMHELGENVHLS